MNEVFLRYCFPSPIRIVLERIASILGSTIVLVANEATVTSAGNKASGIAALSLGFALVVHDWLTIPTKNQNVNHLRYYFSSTHFLTYFFGVLKFNGFVFDTNFGTLYIVPS